MFRKFQKTPPIQEVINNIIPASCIDTLNEQQKILVVKDIAPQQLEQLKQALPDYKIIATQHKAQQKEISLPHIKKIIAVSSGKGGVGKSTIALQLARQLQDQGQKVGILDLDIYGSSLPTLLNKKGYQAVEKDKKFQPLIIDGLEAMSLGFLVDPDKPTIWRGPMVMGAVQQLLRDTNWSNLDVLVLDLPPGTGDAQLTLAQKVRLDGAIIVTTPHDLALIDAQKGLKMFQKMQVPIIGVLENMAYFVCDGCDKRHYIFGQSNIEVVCNAMGVAYLGALPIVAGDIVLPEGVLVNIFAY